MEQHYTVTLVVALQQAALLGVGTDSGAWSPCSLAATHPRWPAFRPGVGPPCMATAWWTNVGRCPRLGLEVGLLMARQGGGTRTTRAWGRAQPRLHRWGERLAVGRAP